MQTLIAWLPLLLCPLMMLFCVLPMLRGKGTCAPDSGISELSADQVRERLAQLQREELALRERLIADEIDGGSRSPTIAVRGAGRSDGGQAARP